MVGTLIPLLAEACSAPLVDREYSASDSASHIQYRMRVTVEPEKARVRMLVTSPTAEVAVWGAAGTFPPPVVSRCKIFDRRNWECSNMNTALRDSLGLPVEVGRLEMRDGVLSETPLFSVPRRYASRFVYFGK